MKFFPLELKNKVKLICGGLLLGLFISFGLAGQPKSNTYKFISPGKTQGIPNAEITCLFQDSYGFIWMGTSEGLYRFNGYECTLFEVVPNDSTSLPGNFIAYSAFYEDKEHNLWIATFEGGLAKFDRKTEKFQRFQHDPNNAQSLNFNPLNAIYPDGRGGFWIGTKGKGLDHYDPQKPFFQHFQIRDNNKDTLMGSNLIVNLRRSKQGDLWIGTFLGAARIDKNGQFHRYFPKALAGLSSFFVTDIYQDHKDRIWLATMNGLNLWASLDSFVHYFPSRSPQLGTIDKIDYIFRIHQDRAGDFWMGSAAGLLRFTPDHEPHFQWIKPIKQDPFSIKPGMIYAMLEDRQGNLWFAPKSGLSILSPKQLIFKTSLEINPQLQNQGMDNIEVRDMLQLEQKNWIAGKGLYVHQDGVARRLLPDDCSALFLSPKRELYVGTIGNHFIYIIDPRSEKILHKIPKAKPGLEHDKQAPVGTHTTAFAVDRFNYLWIGSRGALNRYDPVKKIYQQLYSYPKQAHSLSNSTINGLLIDKKGRLWIATQGGVNRLDISEQKRPITDTLLQFKHFRHDPQSANSLVSDQVKVIFEDSRDWFWFGTDLGISILLPDQRWKHLSRRDGLPSNNITGIIEDKIGRIWITTENNGLCCYNPKSSQLQNFGSADGLLSEKLPNGVIIRHKDGGFLLASTAGVQHLIPPKVLNNAEKAPLYLTQIRLFNQPLKIGGRDGILRQAAYLTKSIRLKYAQDVLSLQFTALNFINPDKQVYRYRLAGFKSLKNWQYLGTQREVHLTNLFPGRYTLEVESTTNPDLRSHWESRITLDIQVEWPWYWRWWAILLYLLILGMIIWLTCVYRLNLKRNSELRKKSESYDYLTHEFRTPLTIILGMVEMIQTQPELWLREGLEKINRNGVLLLKLVNQLLDISRFDAGLMHKVDWEQGDVIALLRYFYESFASYAKSKQIDFEFVASPDQVIMDYDADKLQKIISNLFSNALKFTPIGGNVCCQVKQIAKNQLLIEVRDNGPGIAEKDLDHIFERYIRVGNPLAYEGIGIGLALTKELVKLLGGQIKVSSKLGVGTVFSIVLPLHKNAGLNDGITRVMGDAFQIMDQTVPASGSNSSDSPLVLIVEDNQDLVDYLRACLQQNYNIAVAMDGEAGIQQAFSLSPHIIISDVMMPKKDGFELCRTLKNDARTSHIPIILLTALAETEDRLRGLEDGADAYLSKPFLQRELEICMRKALELREKIKEYFSNPTNIPETPTIKKQHEFVVALNAFLEENYARPLSVTELAAAFHFSEVQLREKLGSLLHHKPQRYILLYRLKKAEERLLYKDESIEEIAAKTGFSDGSHFSNAFLEEYGMRPGEYRKRKR